MPLTDPAVANTPEPLDAGPVVVPAVARAAGCACHARALRARVHVRSRLRRAPVATPPVAAPCRATLSRFVGQQPHRVDFSFNISPLGAVCC
ncbi:hypothetical protein B0O95_10912 [Mycetohabitans endofungorum]|uniref:Uncharacterized protein n=1 Tax=Mycetohabitans endofungorum TaxID=417203 RepID=A0A2P5K8Z9_9BURK|nr:hypothetical protein B0O95_10912 [Mycetohabitans endofungorum]